MADTKIEWTDQSWNPIRAKIIGGRSGWHCVHVSPGCENCYAEKINKWQGTHLPYTPTASQAIGPYIDPRTLDAPTRWKKGQRVFVCTMTDLFWDRHTDGMIETVWRTMRECHQHVFQVLTKRAQRMHDLVPKLNADIVCPPENIWLGVSVEDQRRADERIPLLLQTPAVMRFISLEPVLERVNLRLGRDSLDTYSAAPPIDWVVIGGESGPRARPCDVQDVRDAYHQCRAASVATFIKQLGALAHNGYLFEGDPPVLRPRPLLLKHPKGGDPSEWPEDLRVREFPR